MINDLRWYWPKRQRTIATIGLPGHGKSVFHAALCWDSMHLLSETLSDDRRFYSLFAADEAADRLFYGNATTLHERRVPPPNPRTTPEPAQIQLRGVPRGRGNARMDISLTFYDVAGEAFQSEKDISTLAPYVVGATDFIFIFDPTHPQFSVPQACSLVDRLERFLGRRQLRRVNVIVCLSKVDQMRGNDNWAELMEGCWPDEPPHWSQLDLYFRTMAGLDRQLRHWWGSEGGLAVLNKMPGARLCAISALGHPPQLVSGSLQLTGPPEPFRVRDPLFWVLNAAGVMMPCPE